MSNSGFLDHSSYYIKHIDLRPDRKHCSTKRKFACLGGLTASETAYPSPPMSNPPSPPRSETGFIVSQSQSQTITAADTSSSTSESVRLQPVRESIPDTTAFVATSAPAWTISSSLTPNPAGSLVSTEPPALTESSTIDFATGDSETGPSSSRSGRKAKPHVASACINCKKAHLSCDVSRPCARCIATGKQDTCYDVQHKKRGRPRLREEGEFRVEMSSTMAATPSVSAPSGPPLGRPIAGTRPRRADSFRSLRSQTSEDSPSFAASSPSFAPLLVPHPRHARQHSSTTNFPPTYAPPPYEVATALLNLDLTVLRANRPFRQIMLGGREILGLKLDEFTAPAPGGEGFQEVRNQLRAEREQREPAYLPPILEPGRDPLHGIADQELDRFTQDFADRTYYWTQTQIGMAAQTFPARVRLAKAATYFVVITLPTFRPIEHPPRLQPPPLAPPFTFNPPGSVVSAESYTPQRSAHSLPSPTSANYSYPGISPVSQSPQIPPFSSSPRTYPPAYPLMPYPTQPYSAYRTTAPSSSNPRLPTAEPPIEPMPFTPRSAPIQPDLKPISNPPPPNTSPSGLPGSSSGQAAGGEASQSQQRLSSEEEDEGGGGGFRSAKKRRRMGMDIEDVLQR